MPLSVHNARTFIRPPRFVLGLCLICVGLLTCSTVLAQSSGPRKSATEVLSPAPPETGMMQELPTSTPLEVATLQLREFLKKMRAHAVKYHLQDDPAEIKQMAAEWRKMLAQGHRLHDALLQAAITEFREKPDINGPAGLLLLQISGRNADADRFDNMYEVVQLLKENGANGQSFDLCYGLTAAANNQYAAAKPHLDIAAANLEAGAQEFAKNSKVSEDEKKVVAQKLIKTYDLVRDLSQTAKYEQLWQEELKAREADAAGEPLPRVLIETTKGEIVVELYENNVPNTVANFIELCEKGGYNGLPFHRVLTHFMAQGGDPNRDGTGGPGYAIPTELNGTTDRNFFRGTLGMALSNLPNSGGSQFYICFVPRGNLNGKYVAFGRVVEGMNIVSDLARVDPDDKESEKENMRQDFPDEIISTKVLRKRAHEYKVIKLPEPTAPPAHAH